MRTSGANPMGRIRHQSQLREATSSAGQRETPGSARCLFFWQAGADLPRPAVLAMAGQRKVRIGCVQLTSKLIPYAPTMTAPRHPTAAPARMVNTAQSPRVRTCNGTGVSAT